MGAQLCVPTAPYAPSDPSLSPAALPRGVRAAAEPAPPAPAELPTLLSRLHKPASNWHHWSISDLEAWCRESIRARPQQSSIALLILCTERGALLDLVCESYDGRSRQTDAALRLKKGNVDVDGALRGAARGGEGEGGPRPPPITPPFTTHAHTRRPPSSLSAHITRKHPPSPNTKTHTSLRRSRACQRGVPGRGRRREHAA